MSAREKLLSELIRRQNVTGWLSDETMREIGNELALDFTEVKGTASFYSHFRFEAPAAHKIKVCTGTACHLKGAGQVYDALRAELKIPDGGQCDPARLFSVEKVSCLGCCMLAPAVQIDDRIYGPVDASKVNATLKTFLDSLKRGRTAPPPAAQAQFAAVVQICSCTSCRSAGSEDVRERVRAHIIQKKLPLRVESTGCTGLSHQAPLMRIITPGAREASWGHLTPQLACRIIDLHIENTGLLRHNLFTKFTGALIDRIFTGGSEAAAVEENRIDNGDYDIFHRQIRFTFNGSEQRDPLDVEGWRAGGGGAAIDYCRGTAKREELLEALAAANLRGRGGGGFPTSEKWLHTYNCEEGEKYVICNGDEGDPGAFMDRMLLESLPLRVIEGIAVAVWLVKAKEAILYIRAEYPLAIERVRKGIALLEAAQLIGENAALPELRIPFSVREGAGAFVCGEETALLESIEGRRGIPRPRPPYPSEAGFRGKPTIINNVETFASVPGLLTDPENFTRHGHGTNRGTKSFALAGKINCPGLIEVPLGTTLRTIVEEIGGGVPAPGRFKAVQIGGPSGGCLGADALDASVDFDSLQAAGAMMGSGGLIVLDERDCMVEMARYFTAFSSAESCGRCVVCRAGSLQMTEILTRICEGKGLHEDLAKLKDLGESMRRLSRCGLGRSAANPVLSTLRNFAQEYEEHLAGVCRAGICRSITAFVITDECSGCTLCAQNCPSGAIAFTPWEKHVIRHDICTKCGNCRKVCPEGAVHVLV